MCYQYLYYCAVSGFKRPLFKKPNAAGFSGFVGFIVVFWTRIVRCCQITIEHEVINGRFLWLISLKNNGITVFI